MPRLFIILLEPFLTGIWVLVGHAVLCGRGRSRSVKVASALKPAAKVFLNSNKMMAPFASGFNIVADWCVVVVFVGLHIIDECIIGPAALSVPLSDVASIHCSCC